MPNFLNLFRRDKTDYRNTYVIGDVHGCYYTLLQLIEKLPAQAKLIFVGDLCDKGNYSKDVVAYVVANKHQCILGNHEYHFLNNIDEPESAWATERGFGGYKTLQSYGGDKKLLREHLQWMQGLPSYIMIGKYFITHGFGLPYYQRRDDESSKRALMSNRSGQRHFKEWGHDWEKGCFDYDIVNIFGHDYASSGPTSDKNYHNIDSGCVYGEWLTAISLTTSELITQATDDRDIVTLEKGFAFIPHLKSPFGFSIKAPQDCPQVVGSVSKHGDTGYIDVRFSKNTEDGQINKSYLFDESGNHIPWNERYKQIKDSVETKEYPGGYKIVRTRAINFDREGERTNDILYKNNEIIDTQNPLVTYAAWGGIDWLYEEHFREIERQKEKEANRLAKVKDLLSKNIKGQKNHIADEVIYYTMMSIFYGPVRDCGPLKSLSFQGYQHEYQELDPEHLHELFIHALTAFALVQNESESYENVDVAEYVRQEAESCGLQAAFEKYFDADAKIDTSKVLG